MSKNIVICCDGTGNEIDHTISNVLKLYRVLEKSERQRVFYHPGVGTIGQQNAWQRFKQKASGVFGLATGHGLDDNVLEAYRFLCRTYEERDKVWLFGFSRGAYTARVLAAFVHTIGVLRPDQLNLAPYALTSYKNASDSAERLEAAWHFSRVAGGSAIPIEFIGVWDTVASVIVPRKDHFWPSLQTLRFTRTNNSVRTFRQAIAIDERRRMFRLNGWTPHQVFRPNPFKPSSAIPQDVRQVWFAGVHGDVGGGYREEESGLSKYPLAWMIDEAAMKGLLVNRAMVNHLVMGHPHARSRHQYVAPDAHAVMHDSLRGGWKLLEWLPKKLRWREWSQRCACAGWYFPRGEPRHIPEDALIHHSVIDRMQRLRHYRPVNLPRAYSIE